MNTARRILIAKVGPVGIVAFGLIVLACSSAAHNSSEAPSQAPAAVEPDVAKPVAERPAEMLSIVLKLTDQGIETIQVDRVENSMNRRDPYRRQPTFYRVLDSNGRQLYEHGFRMETEIRAESVDKDGKMSGTRIPVDEPVFTIKVPAFADLSTIELYRAQAGQDRASAELLGEVRP